MSAEISLTQDILKNSEKSTDESETLKEPLSKNSQETAFFSESEETIVDSKVEVSKGSKIAKETLPLQVEVDLPKSIEDIKIDSNSLPLPLKGTSLDNPVAVDSIFPSKVGTATPYRENENLDQVNQYYLMSEEYNDDLNKAVDDAESNEREICLLKFEGHPVRYKNDISKQMMMFNQSKCYFLGGSKEPDESSFSEEEK